MAGSSIGNIFRVTTFGESHGEAIGVIVDGVPAGLSITEEDIQKKLDLRKPGTGKFTTPRKESDTVHIQSGIFDGRTTGTPISMVIYNENQHSKDYSEIASYYRPGHADFTFDEKYGFRDYRGGGRSSGRETAARVAAGALAMKILEELGINVNAFSKKIAGVSVDEERMDMSEKYNNAFFMPDREAAALVEEKASAAISKGDSVGGIIECHVDNMMTGIGETVFEKLDARLCSAIMSIGAVKGVEIGAGFDAADMCGSEDNDRFTMKDGRVSKLSNNAGGILGGMSDGSRIIIRAAVKPTPSISSLQKTVNKSGEDIEVSIKGRHDPMIVPRAVVVVESMAAITLVDLIMENMSARMDKIKEFYAR